MGGNAEGAAVAALATDEDVCRLCFSASIPIVDEKFPNQVDPSTGYIRLEEISHRQVKRGFSLQRKQLYSLREAREMTAAREANKRAKGIVADYVLAGVLVARVDAIHAIGIEQGSQVFEVRSVPIPGQPGHAEIHFKTTLLKEDFLELRMDLQRALGKLQAPEILDIAA